MKWSTFHSDIPPSSARLVAKRSGPPPIPPWIMGIVAIVLALVVCVVAYTFFSGSGKASPAPATASPTSVTTAPTTSQTSTPATSVLAPPATAALTPFRLPAVVTATPVPPAPSLCDTRTAETRYVADANGVYVFDTAQDGGASLGLISFRSAVQTYGTVEGRLSSNSNKWFVVRYNNRCAYAWADAKESRLSLTKPK